MSLTEFDEVSQNARRSNYDQTMPTIAEVLDQIEQGARPSDLESTVLEFKEEAPSIKETLSLLADAVVCMANSEGGTIVLGVSDKKTGAPAIVGVTGVDQSVVLKGVFDRTRPSLSVAVLPHRRQGRDVLELVVPKGATLYSNQNGTATRRVNDECRPFTPEEQRQVLAARGQHDWSSLPAGDFRPDDLQMARLRSLLREAGQLDLADRDDRAILSDLRLIAPDGNLTNAGLLLVGKESDLGLHIPQHEISYQYRPSQGSEATSRIRTRKPLLEAIDGLLSAISSRADVRPLNIAGGVQLRREDYPAEAVRELVVNALVHRDYELTGSVDVEHSPDVLVISNPGGLVHGVTPDNILSHPSTPRNRLLLETVTLLQVAERTGQGIDRAYRVLLRSGKKPPTFLDSGTSVSVRVAGGGGNASFMKFVRNGIDEAMASDIEVLLALDYLCNSRRITAAKLAPIIQRSEDDARRVLTRMAEARLLAVTRRSAATASPAFELTDTSLTGLGFAVEYHRRTAPGGEDKVIDHLREYGYITNSTIRRLFDVEVFAARDILKDMSRRGVIEKADGPSRGPSVKYKPGPRFPSS